MCALGTRWELGIAAMVTVLALPVAPTSAQGTFTKLAQVADSNTLVPGGALGSTFSGFGGGLSLDDGQVAFQGAGSGGEVGIYVGGPEGLRTVADLTTNLPDSTSTFTGFTAPSLDEGQVAFGGSGSGGEIGIYVGGAGGLTTIADLTTNLPGSTSTFSGFFSGFTSSGFPSLDDGQVAFQGVGSGGEEGIYVGGSGGLRTIADLTTSYSPWAGSFRDLWELVSIDDGQVAFTGSASGVGGVFVSGPAGLSAIGQVGGELLIGPSLDDGRVAVLDVIPGGESAILRGGPGPGGARFVPKTVQGSARRLDQVFLPSLAHGQVAFVGSRTASDGGKVTSGVYLERGGALEKVIETGDMIDTRLVTEARLLTESLSDNQLAFAAGFTDGSSSIFIAELQPVSPSMPGM